MLSLWTNRVVLILYSHCGRNLLAQRLITQFSKLHVSLPILESEEEGEGEKLREDKGYPKSSVNRIPRFWFLPGQFIYISTFWPFSEVNCQREMMLKTAI